MGEIARVDPTGMTTEEKLDALLHQGHQLHHCLETHIGATELAFLSATEARERLERKVDGLATGFGALDTRQDIVEGSVSAMAKALGAKLPQGARAVKVEAPMSWKDIGKVGLTVLGALSGFVLLIQILAPGIAASFEALMRAKT